MADKTINEKIIEGLENGDIFLADPGVTVETITIAEYAEVRARGLELLRETDFSAFANGVPAETFPAGTPQCEIDEATATLRAYARGDFSPHEAFTAQALALLGDFPDSAGLVASLNSVEAPDPTPVTPTTPDPLVGTAADDVLKGSGADDVLRGKGGDDRLLGRAGDDKLIGGGGADTVKGGGGDDVVKGGGGGGDLKGNGGADNLKGGGGGDTLKGGGGGDMITGGGGDDLMVGGGGADMFVFAGNSGADRINGFTFGVDKLDIRRANSFEDLNIEQASNGVQIEFDGGEVLLTGRFVSALSEDDFMF